MLKDTLEGAGFKNTTLENTTFENTLFADSMLETSWAERTRRNWMTMTSFGLQALMIGLLLLLPVLKTVGLPQRAPCQRQSAWDTPARNLRPRRGVGRLPTLRPRSSLAG